MEMHQVRYFLAVARTLEFHPRGRRLQRDAAVADARDQAARGRTRRRSVPARAARAQLTELGQRMHPLLKQCYEAASAPARWRRRSRAARSARCAIALTHSIDLSLLIPSSRPDQAPVQPARIPASCAATAGEVGEFLKNGEAELGIAAELDEDWDRLDVWPLFTEGFRARRQRPASAWPAATASSSTICAASSCCRARYCEHAGADRRLVARARDRRRAQVTRSHRARPDRAARSGYRRCRDPAHRADAGHAETRRGRWAGCPAHRPSLWRRRAASAPRSHRR